MCVRHQTSEKYFSEVVVISSDKDLCQFVRDGQVHIFDAMKQKYIREKDVIEKFGVPVGQVCDYLAIVGDSSDNIPGIAGFGPKKAVDLLSKYDTLERIYDHLDELTPKMAEILIAQKENAFLSQQLATIITDLEIEDIPGIPSASGCLTPEYISLLTGYEFRSLIPQSHLAPQKETPKIETIQIDTIGKLEVLQMKIGVTTPSATDTGIHPSRGESRNKVIISTDISGKIVIGYEDEIYVIDSRVVDCSELITLLLE
jgi:5'-3' exonuclease